MAEVKEYTFQDVAEHNTKNDMFCVIHDKVYDCTKFLDEHPGGEEVMLDVAGQDSTEAFEDVGHSDEAREVLEKLYVGELKRQAGDPGPKSAPSGGNTAPSMKSDGGLSLGLYAVVVAGGFLAYAGYQYLQQQAAAQTQQQA
ncbi:cytochrome b5-like heme/steroid binding domain-containing protein [Ilyonectria destructans]|nr:cytochrome b5-like heme/steroid binding domain-containing protein [Ilyonectria destructans]